MRLSISAQFTLKECPKDFRGMSGASISWGKDKSVRPSVMAYSVVREIFEWCTNYMSIDDLNTELEALRVMLKAAQMGEKGKE